MTQIFAYIPFTNGVAADVALEYPSAAKKIDESASLTAVVTGSGADLDKVANEMTSLYSEVIKIDHADLAYPNGEVVRKALVNVIPADAIFLTVHDTFGMDMAPGLSIKMDSAYAADIVDFEGIDGTSLKAVRQELGGAVSTHVTIDISSGAFAPALLSLLTADQPADQWWINPVLPVIFPQKENSLKLLQQKRVMLTLRSLMCLYLLAAVLRMKKILKLPRNLLKQ